MLYFSKNVKLTDGKGTLLTQDLQYDMNQKIGIYSNGGKVINKTTTLTSKEGTYYSDTKDIYFRKDVVLIDPQYQLRADSLLYNTEFQLATFITKTTIVDSGGSTIVTKEGNYDLKNHKAVFGKRAVIRQGSQIITGDKMNIDEATGKSTATGNAVYKDTAQNISVLAGELLVDQKTNTFIATISPLAILKEDKDSVYITADTLYSGIFSDSTLTDSTVKKDTVKGRMKISTKPTNDSSSRYLQGYHHVRIFSDSLQSVADSLFCSPTLLFG
jgi:lipopolysaccharide assembly outer membrane protein LptD (OstA)